MNKKWERKKDLFKKIDVRKMSGNFLPMILIKAGKVKVNEGICVIQSFEPIPLYSALAEFGFEHLTEKISDNEYRVYFYRIEKKEAKNPYGMDAPLKPTAIVNFKQIDDSLADIVVNFWNYTWGKEDSAIDRKTKLLLSLANGVGVGRFRQATREMIKAYALGVTTAELDELFSMFAWNQGIGTFSSEIGPSPLFGAYKLIKSLEKKELNREEVMKNLLEKFGEKNPDVTTFYKKQ